MTKSKSTNTLDVPVDARLAFDEAERGQRWLLIEHGLGRAMVASVTGLCLTGFVLELGGRPEHVGWMQAAVLLGGIFQVATNWILSRVASRKRFCLLTLATARVLRGAVAGIPFLLIFGIERNVLLISMGALLMLAGVFGTSAEVARQSWIADLVPAGMRGRFLGKRMQIGGAVSMLVVLLYGWFIDAWAASGQDPVGAFQILIGFGVGAGFGSLWCISRAPEPPMHRNKRPTGALRSLGLPFQHRQFRRFMTLHVSYSFAAAFCGGFFHLFMLQFLGMTYGWIAVSDFLSHLVGLAAARYWGTLADRWGSKRMLTLALTVKAIFPFLWLGLMPQWWYLVFAVVLVRAFNTAQEVGFVNLALHLAPKQDRAAYISMYRGCTNLSLAIAPALAGGLVAVIGDRVWSFGVLPFSSLHVLFVCSGILRLLSLLWLRKLREPHRP